MSPTAPLLTVDLGNSTCDLRLWAGAEPRDAGSASTEVASFEHDFEALLAELPPVRAAALSSVGDARREAALEAALERRFGAGVVLRPDPGLLVTCRDVHTIGTDRLFAARGAAETLGTSAIVVDAGTALTVDAVEVSGDGPPLFRGGAIAPGPRLLARALATAAKLREVEPRPGAAALGQDTPEALLAGVTVGFRGAARELVLRVGEESGLGHGTVALCGGARIFLLEAPLFPADCRVHVLPDLVHVGLAAAAGSGARG